MKSLQLLHVGMETHRCFSSDLPSSGQLLTLHLYKRYAVCPAYVQCLLLCTCVVTELACKRGALSNLKLLDVSYNSRVGDAGWVSFFREAGGLKQLQELDISLRPDACLSASAWVSATMEALPQLPLLRRVSMQRWILRSEERLNLENILKKRNVLLEWDEVDVQNVAD